MKRIRILRKKMKNPIQEADQKVLKPIDQDLVTEIYNMTQES